MDTHPTMHACGVSRRCARLIAGVGLAGTLFAGVLFPVPARAITTQTEATLTETQQHVESSAADLETATKHLETLQAQAADNEANIAALEAQLPAVQSKASKAMRGLYKYQKGSNALMGFMLNTQSLDEFITTMKYMGQVQDANLDAVEQLNDIQTQLETEKAELDVARAQAEREQKAAADALADAQQQRDAAQAKAEAEMEAEAALLAQAAAQDGQDAGSIATVDTGAVDWNVDQATFVATWTERIDAYLAGSPLAGQGKTFAEAAWNYGVDPRWSPAISNTESSKGLNCFKPHNAWGWGQMSWNSWEEAIDAHVAGLARGYGYTISVAGAKKYCPPNWFNWYNDTAREMMRI